MCENMIECKKYENLTECQKEKRNFVQEYLSPLTFKISGYRSRYIVDQRTNEEYVFIDCGSVSPLKICVTADSLIALSRDVLKNL